MELPRETVWDVTDSQTTPIFKEGDSLETGQRIRERKDQEGQKDSDSNHSVSKRAVRRLKNSVTGIC